MIIKFICAFFFSNSGNNLRTHQLQGSLVSLIDRSFDFRLMEVFWNGSIVVSNDKSNPMFSTRQPLEQWPPSRHPSNKTSSNHDPSPPRKLPCTAQSTKAYINVMRPWPGASSSIKPPPTGVASLLDHPSSSFPCHIYVPALYRHPRKRCPIQGNPTT